MTEKAREPITKENELQEATHPSIEPPADGEAPAMQSEDGKATTAQAPEAIERAPRPQQEPSALSATTTQGAGLWAWGGWGLLTALLGAALALIILGAANGTLNFASRDTLQTAYDTLEQVQRQQTALREQVSAISGELATIQRRMEELTQLQREMTDVQGQTAALATETAQLAQELDSLRSQANGMRAQIVSMDAQLQETQAQLEAGMKSLNNRLDSEVTSVNQRVDTIQNNVGLLQQATKRYDTFLTGLRELLLTLQGPTAEEPTSGPAATPTGEPEPTPTPENAP